jgi:hypothetical protein
LDIYREWKNIQNSQTSIVYEFGKIRPRGRTRNRRQDEVREDGRIVGGEVWQEKNIQQRGMEEDPDNGKESLHSAHVNGINEKS